MSVQFWRLIDLYRLPSLMVELTGTNPAPTIYDRH